MICMSCLLALRDILHTPMTRYSLFVLKVQLNTKQTNKQTSHMLCHMRTYTQSPHQPTTATTARAYVWAKYSELS